MEKVLLVLTNMPDVASAQQLAQQVITQRVAACVNQLSPCVSTYEWEGKVEQATEVPLLIKTTEQAYPRLQQVIREYHPYQLPEIIAVPVVAGLPDYLSWVAAQAV